MDEHVPDSEPKSHERTVDMITFEHLALVSSPAAYVCRGCGTEIANKGAFVRCPVCGIVWG